MAVIILAEKTLLDASSRSFHSFLTMAGESQHSGVQTCHS